MSRCARWSADCSCQFAGPFWCCGLRKLVSNPVDALTRLAQDLSGLPHRQVLGTGTLIDTVRLRALLAEYCGAHPVDLRVYVLGEHGDARFALFSAATAGGAPIDVKHGQLARFAAEARDGGYAVPRAVKN